MQLAGLNHLRLALETKKNMLQFDIPQDSTKHKYIKWYIDSQSKIFSSAIKQIKKLEKEILSNEKSKLITLKNVYKKDSKFLQSLLFLGFPDYESILQSEFQDQCWILWLMRCYNRDQYSSDEFYHNGFTTCLCVSERKPILLHKKFSTINRFTKDYSLDYLINYPKYMVKVNGH